MSFLSLFIHSDHFYSASSSPLLLRGAPDSTDTVPEFHTEAPQATVSEGLARGPYMVARAVVELMTLRTKGVDSTNAPHTPHNDTHSIKEVTKETGLGSQFHSSGQTTKKA